MKLIIISNPEPIDNETTIVNYLFDEGLEYFHLRKPNCSLNEMEEYLQHISPNHLNKIVLHAHHELADKYKLKGKHKTATTIDTTGNTRYISTSFHSLEDIKSCKENYEYVFLSPVFNSISKQGYKSNLNLIEVKQFLQNKNSLSGVYPDKGGGEKWGGVIALGGINEYNTQTVLEMGFSGIALLGDIWNSDDKIKSFKRINLIIQKQGLLSK